jgi:glutamate decarboxylase
VKLTLASQPDELREKSSSPSQPVFGAFEAPVATSGYVAREVGAGCAGGMPRFGCSAELAHERVYRELDGDGKPRQNLASFVTTSMDGYARQIALSGLERNLVNSTEYPQTDVIHGRIVRWIAELFHAPWSDADAAEAGVTSIGSSEAVMLALIVHRINWRKRNPDSVAGRPYLVVGSHAHVCFSKFAKYFDVGIKVIALEPGQYSLTPTQVEAVLKTRIVDDPEVLRECGQHPETVGNRRVGELVMAIGCIAGTTYTGHCDDVEGIDRMLTAGDWDVPIHVDAASGGFVLPFTDPTFRWDFRLPNVQSVNVSNHKYGLVYCGLATLIFRSREIVDPGVWIDVPYLSGAARNFGLSFSRSSSGILTQYYNFLTLGREGYQRIIARCLAIAQHIGHWLEAIEQPRPCFKVVSNTRQLPVVTFGLAAERDSLSLEGLARHLKLDGWTVPVYPLPSSLGPTKVMRIVVRSDFTEDDAVALLRDVTRAVRAMV